MSLVYIVTADTYCDDYGSMIDLFGVYTDEEKAKKRCEELNKKEGYSPKINKVTLNKRCDIYLGGYIE